MRGLGVSSAERREELPDVPTFAESGYPDYLVSVWFASHDGRIKLHPCDNNSGRGSRPEPE